MTNDQTQTPPNRTHQGETMKTVYEHTEKKTVLGEIDYKLDELTSFAKWAVGGIVFYLLLNTVLLSIILARVLWGCR